MLSSIVVGERVAVADVACFPVAVWAGLSGGKGARVGRREMKKEGKKEKP